MSRPSAIPVKSKNLVVKNIFSFLIFRHVLCVMLTTGNAIYYYYYLQFLSYFFNCLT